jgi:hypothetical protein
MYIHLGPGPRALGNLRALSRQMYGGGRRARDTNELRSRTQAVQRQAVSEVLASGFGEGQEAREEALGMLRDLLPEVDYRRVTDAARGTEFPEGGALVKLSHNGTVSVASAVALRTDYPAWYHYSHGPRFDQRLFRTGILRLLLRSSVEGAVRGKVLIAYNSGAVGSTRGTRDRRTGGGRNG